MCPSFLPLPIRFAWQFSCLLLLALLTGCFSFSGRGEQKIVELRLAGSNTVFSAAIRPLTEAFLQAHFPGAQVRVVQENPETILWEVSARDSLFRIHISGFGTHTGFDSLAKGRADIVMASREVFPEEAAVAGFAIAQPQAYRELAYDGISIVVHPSNPVNSLTKEQVMQIFTGEITNWKQVGGKNAGITVYARDSHSGTYDSFRDLVLQPYGKVGLRAGIHTYYNSFSLSQDVSQDPDAIGFVSFAAVENAKALRISEGNAVGFRTTALHLKTGEYPLCRTLRLYFNPASENTLLRAYMAFLEQPKVLSRLDSLGLVSTLADFLPADTPLTYDTPPVYQQLQKHGLRYAFNLSFLPTSSDFSPATAAHLAGFNLKLLQHRLATENQKLVAVFFFYTDSRVPITQATLAERTQRVKEYFHSAIGITPKIVILENTFPLVDIQLPGSHLKNDRVELWLMPTQIPVASAATTRPGAGG